MEMAPFPLESVEKGKKDHCRTEEWIKQTTPKIIFHAFFHSEEFRAFIDQNKINIEF